MYVGMYVCCVEVYTESASALRHSHFRAPTQTSAPKTSNQRIHRATVLSFQPRINSSLPTHAPLALTTINTAPYLPRPHPARAPVSPCRLSIPNPPSTVFPERKTRRVWSTCRSRNGVSSCGFDVLRIVRRKLERVKARCETVFVSALG
jgi:hypothetical protein